MLFLGFRVRAVALRTISEGLEDEVDIEDEEYETLSR